MNRQFKHLGPLMQNHEEIHDLKIAGKISFLYRLETNINPQRNYLGVTRIIVNEGVWLVALILMEVLKAIIVTRVKEAQFGFRGYYYFSNNSFNFIKMAYFNQLFIHKFCLKPLKDLVVFAIF